MEGIPDHIKNMDVDDAASEVMEKCFTNKIVVNKILEHFPDRQLLDQLSFVNKMWNYEARNVMQKRGNLLANFETANESPSKAFKYFLRNLQRMNVVPFGGIHAKVSYFGQRLSLPTRGRDFHFEGTLERLLKHFSVELRGGMWDYEDSPALLFIKQVLHHSSSVLETLSLRIFGRRKLVIPEILKHFNFPRLKIFKPLYSLNVSDESFVNSIRTLLSLAPNLQELHCDGNINLIAQLLEGTSVVLVFEETVKAPFNEISDTVIGVLRLKEIQLLYTGQEFNFQRFNRIAPILLRVSCTTTLRSMTIDAVLAVPLMTYGVSLQNVKYLDMFINYDQLELTQPRILRIINEFDFTRIFPSLDNVTVKPSQPQVELGPGHINRIMEEANAVLREPLPDRAVNIKKLSLNVGLSHANAQFFTQMFPKLRNLWIEGNSEPFPLGYIWEYWRDLESLGLVGTIRGNADCLFCGIFPEEMAELRRMDDEYLERVNIVPVMPAITCLRNLNDLTLKIRTSPRPRQHSTRLSKVTWLVAFKRLSLH